jgi:small subunit ribosomal protein S20
MANTRSAEKRARQTEKRTLRNRMLKSRIKTFRKRVESAVQSGDKAVSTKELSSYFSVLDRAVKANVIHKNTAGRYKSCASRWLANISA